MRRGEGLGTLTRGRVAMEFRRVFIIYRSPLFAQGLRSLLSAVRGLEVVGIGAEQPKEEVWGAVQRLVPDVIILEEGDETPLAKIMDASPDSQLVTLSLTHNRIRAFAHRDIPCRGLEGVIEAISEASKGLEGNCGV